MPILADIQAAVPRCLHTPGVRTMTGLQRASGRRCCAPLRYVERFNLWRCPECGNRVAGELVGSQISAAEGA